MDDRTISLKAALDAIDANNGILYDNPTLVASLKKMLSELPPAQPGEDIKAMCGECDAWNQYKNYPQLRWIPTSERTPEKSGMYLVTTPDGQVELRYYSTLYRWHGWVDMVAWMPLPQPWEGNRNE